jgi:hypothetical protein
LNMTLELEAKRTSGCVEWLTCRWLRVRQFHVEVIKMLGYKRVYQKSKQFYKKFTIGVNKVSEKDVSSNYCPTLATMFTTCRVTCFASMLMNQTDQ